METLEQRIEGCRETYRQAFADEPAFVSYAPGRINIIGEHTDYNQGYAMPCAINRWVTVAVSARPDTRIIVHSADFSDTMELDVRQSYQPLNDWQKYVYGCIRLYMLAVPVTRGFQAVITGNVPLGSGVSSSAALEVACINAFNHLSEERLDPLACILLCQQVEHQYLQVKSGLLDQYASQFSKEGCFLLLDFLSLSHRYISAGLHEYVWLLCDTGVQRTLAGSKYSERVEETQEAFLFLQSLFSEIRHFRDVEEWHLDFIQYEAQEKRMRHYLSENKRVQEAATALQYQDMKTFGKLLTDSHYSLKDLYEVSCPELDFLVEQAHTAPGCMGSRMMGGGFGGCTLNLVRADAVDAFSKKIAEAYAGKFNTPSTIHCYQSAAGAGIHSVKSNVSHLPG